LREQGFTEKEVIVINNDHSEELEMKRIQEKYEVVLLSSNGNIGFAAAANQAAEKASGGLLFFVNPDTKWREPLLSKIYKHFENQTLSILGVGLCSPEGFLEKRNGGSFFSWRSFFINDECQGANKKHIQEINWVSGGALVCRPKLFSQLKGFDERFFMYFEDMDFCKRAKEQGFLTFLDQSLCLTHFRGRSHSSKKSQKRIYDQSLYLYVEKHWPLVARIPFLLVHKIYRFFYPYGR
jgi:GT2 family glycosyltransferase